MASKPLAVWSDFLRQKCLWSSVHVVRWGHVNKAQTPDQAENLKTVLVFAWLCFSGADWLSRQMSIIWSLQRRGRGSKGNLHQNSQTVTEQGRGPISSPKSLGQFVTVTHAQSTCPQHKSPRKLKGWLVKALKSFSALHSTKVLNLLYKH